MIEVIEFESKRKFLFCGFDRDFVLLADTDTGVFTWTPVPGFNTRFGLALPEKVIP